MRKFLSFWEIVSQVWLSEPMVIMALVILKVYLFTRVVIAALSSLGDVASKACLELNDLLDTVLNTLYYVSMATQDLIEYAMDLAVDLAKDLISLVITVAKSMIKLLIELYLGTLACLCTAFVKGCLDLVEDLISTITEYVQDALDAVISAINTITGKLTLLINGFLKGIAAIESLFLDDSDSISDTISNLNVTISSLSDITIPTTFADAISNLSDSIPDFEDVLLNLTDIVTAPLTVLDEQVLQIAVDETYDNPFTETNYDVLKDTCDKLEQVFDDSVTEAQKISNWILISLGIATFLLLIFLVWSARRKWKRKSAIIDTLTYEHLQIAIGNLIQQHSHPLLHLLVKNFDPRIQWLVYYTTTPTLARCAMIGIVGVCGWALQLMVLNCIEKELSGFSGSAANSKYAEFVSEFANDTSAYISSTQDGVNNELLQPVTDLATDLYDVILDAEKEINSTINSVFGDSVFAKPLQTIIYCTIGRKLETIEEGLEWVIKNAHLNLTSYTTLYVESASENSATSIDSVSSGISDFVDSASSLVQDYRETLEIELIIALAFFGVWLLMFIVGCAILGYREYTRPDIQQQMISVPAPLNEDEKKELGYPFRDPFAITASSKYTDLLNN